MARGCEKLLKSRSKSKSLIKTTTASPLKNREKSQKEVDRSKKKLKIDPYLNSTLKKTCQLNCGFESTLSPETVSPYK